MSSSMSFGDKMQEALSRRGAQLAKILSAKGSEAEARMSKVGDAVRKSAEKAAENVKAEQHVRKEGDKKKTHDAAKKGQNPQGKKQPAKEPCKKCGDGKGAYKCPKPGGLGTLSASEESGKRGSAAIGWDIHGGWSYGTYQMSTNQGTMEIFLEKAANKSEKIVEKLKAAGGNEAALKGRPEFKAAWREVAKDPTFKNIEHDVMMQTNYEPQVKRIRTDTGLDVNNRSATLKDVVWSVSIQHGPNSKLVKRALGKKNVSKMTDAEIIDAIYKERSKPSKKNPRYLAYFEESKLKDQPTYRERFARELFCAKYMLANENNDK